MRPAVFIPLILGLAGCGAGASDDGTTPPPHEQVTEKTLESMPPEARKAAEASMARDAAMAKQMNDRFKGSGGK